MTNDDEKQTDNQSVRSAAWPAFESALARVLQAMDEDQYLILNEKFHHRFVQFAVQGAHGIRVEVSSNEVLPIEAALPDTAQSRLIELGFSPPTGPISESTWDKDPDGSPNFYVDGLPEDEVQSFVERVTDVLCDALEIYHPGGLWYSAFDGAGAKLVFPSLGLTNKERPPRTAAPADEDTVESVAVKLTVSLSSLVDDSGVELDENKHTQLSSNGIEIHVGVLDGPLRVRVWAPVLEQVAGSLELLQALQEVNGKLAFGRVFLADDRVIIADDVWAGGYDEASIFQSIGYLTWAADHLDDDLVAVINADTSRTSHVAGYL